MSGAAALAQVRGRWRALIVRHPLFLADRVLIPPSQGYSDCGRDQPQPPTFATKRQLANHCKEPLLFELALLRVTPST